MFFLLLRSGLPTKPNRQIRNLTDVKETYTMHRYHMCPYVRLVLFCCPSACLHECKTTTFPVTVVQAFLIYHARAESLA